MYKFQLKVFSYLIIIISGNSHYYTAIIAQTTRPGAVPNGRSSGIGSGPGASGSRDGQSDYRRLPQDTAGSLKCYNLYHFNL